MKKIIVTSYGLTSKIGRKLIAKELKKDSDLHNKKVFLFHEPYYSIEDILVNVCAEIGFQRENVMVVDSAKAVQQVEVADYIYITEGNIFKILDRIRKYGITEAIKEAVERGCVYIGASAGAMLAGTSVEEALNMDENRTLLDDFTALELYDGLILPHYEKNELKRYIANSPGITKRYKNIVSIANDEIRVLES